MPDRMRLIIAEDHYLVREGTRRLLDDTGTVDTVATVGTAEELLDATGRLALNAVIVDIRMPPGHSTEGITAAHTIRQRHPHIGVVVLSQHANENYALRAVPTRHRRPGLPAQGTHRRLDELLRALHKVIAGRSVIDPRVVEVLLHRRSHHSPLDRLTIRELDVLRHMAQGKNNRAIAESLALAESTVEKHVNSTFAKLGLGEEAQFHRRVAAVLTYLRHHHDS